MNSYRIASWPALCSLVVGVIWLLSGNEAFAQCYRCRPRPSSGVVTVAVIGDDRGTLSWTGSDSRCSCGYHRGGSRIDAREGERYRLRLTNESEFEVGLVVAVDGRNVVTGDPSYGRAREGMYVLPPYRSIDIAGWRSGLDQVQRFYFTRARDSYAGRMGDSSQLGVIKVHVFRSRTRVMVPPIRYSHRDEYQKAAPSAAGSARESLLPQREKAGTGYGEGSYDPVRETDFDPESFASQIVTITYDWPTFYERPYPRPYSYPYERRDRFAPPPP